MILFNSDYLEGTHPRILERLMATNMEQTPGYGQDDYCRKAAKRIRELCKCQQAAVHFLVGGTQTNLTVISAALKPHQGVLAADTGHIFAHETGAIEATGHKVLVLQTGDGKLTGAQVKAEAKKYRNDPAFEHVVQPKMVYISMPTELGGIYTRQELADLSSACRENGMYLYLDGARLGYGLSATGSDLDFPAIAQYCDAFYIGGTKMGALFGEAVVLTNRELQQDFRCIMKQKGGMLAKGRLLGIQFLTLFEDGLYFDLGKHGIAMADRLKRGLAELGMELYCDSPTNQQFVVMENALLEKVEREFGVERSTVLDEKHTVVRFCTSWATREEQVECLLDRLKELI